MSTELTHQLKAVVRRLLKAYATGEARGGSMDWEDVDSVFEAAKAALPGEYEKALIYACEAEESAEGLADEPQTYRIVRRYHRPDGVTEHTVIHTRYTLEQAQEHCQDPNTRGPSWFDGYEEE